MKRCSVGIYYSHVIRRCKSSDNKVARKLAMIKLNKENKSLFGDLLKPPKKGRCDLETRGIIINYGDNGNPPISTKEVAIKKEVKSTRKKKCNTVEVGPSSKSGNADTNDNENSSVLVAIKQAISPVRKEGCNTDNIGMPKSSFIKRCESSNKKVAVIRLIKENESLFGALLKSPKKKSKCLSETIDIPVNVENANMCFSNKEDPVEKDVKSTRKKKCKTVEVGLNKEPGKIDNNNKNPNVFALNKQTTTSVVEKNDDNLNLDSSTVPEQETPMKRLDMNSKTEKLDTNNIGMATKINTLINFKNTDAEIHHVEPTTEKDITIIKRATACTGKEKPNDKAIDCITESSRLSTNSSIHIANCIEPTNVSESFDEVNNGLYIMDDSKPELNPSLITGLYPSVSSPAVYKYPAVTRILNRTMSEQSQLCLKRWKEKLIAEMGEEGFNKFNQNQMMMGVMMHDLVHKHITGTPLKELEVNQDLKGCFKSLSPVFPLIDQVKGIELNVVHKSLNYRGITDCIAHYRNKPVLIDWKKSDKVKSSIKMTYEAPLQIAAYIGAINHDDNYPFAIREGLLVIAYTDGFPATIFHLHADDCKQYWKQWLLRLNQYNTEFSAADG